MKSIEEFLSDLRRNDVNLWAEGERLRYKGSPQTLTPTLLQELKERKAEILTFLHNANTATHTNLPPILPTPRDKNLPLSFAQQRLWFLDQLEPNSSAYNMPAAYRLTGQLNITALEQSLNQIIQRHEILRTTFPSIDGQPSQAIAPPITLTLPITDLREHPKTEKEAIAQQLANEEAQQPFNLATSPLLRVKLLHLAETEYVLILNMHHIISDGWSFDVFFRELQALYTAFSTNKSSPLPELPIQYADFAHWQRDWLQDEILESQLSYWKQQLGGNLSILQLPTDYPRPPVQTYPGAYQSLELSLDLTQALKALSQQEEVTLFMTLLAAFETLLHRYSGQEDIIIGTPIAGRNQVETEALIGFFVNTLALRTHLNGNPSFHELLIRVRQVALGAYSHQNLPFEKLVEALQPERDRSRTPLFQVMFTFQNTSTSALELPGLTINSLNIDTSTAKFDLTLVVRETTQGLVVSLEYNTDLFAATTITRMLGHFQTLLESIVANPEQHLSDLSLLTPTEQHQLLVEWNNTRTDYPNHTCIHQLFEAQVERTPNATAVIFENQKLTYQELNHRANQLAHYLQNLGVKPEVLVGICLEKSLELIVGLLAILKAGGVYVPFDSNYPNERLAFMMEDTQVPVLLTQQSLIEKLPSNTAHVVCLDTDWKSLSYQNEDNPTSNTTADNLAYIIYTSGSTGRPKGVTVPHQAVIRLLFNTNYIKLKSDDRVAQVSNTSFDAATFEIWGALLHGGTLVLIKKDVLLSKKSFTVQLHEQKISVLFLTTALFNQLASTIPQAFKNLRYLLFGGEAVDPQWVKEMLKQGSTQRLLHVYGPTESTTFSSWHWVQDVPKEATTLPIGRPISNTQLYILDRHLNLVPIGVPGELYIGGDGLAKGYLNRPELTKEKFIPSPFSDDIGSHLYRTGDLAHYLPDGNIEFLGRLDNQVKIRGFRIELGEIEAAIAQHPNIQQTIVTAREDNLGDKQLVAYIVPHQEQALTSDALRRFLKQKLPDYMIPSAFVILDTLPLTPNGKIDHRALPTPEQIQQEPSYTFVAPRDDLELQLTKIWEYILGKKPISVNDNFFDLGGHSLLAVRLFTQIEKTFGKTLPLATLFQAATITELANILRESEWSAPQSSLISIQPNGSKPPFFGIHTDDGSILYFHNLVNYLDSDQPFYGLQAQGLDGDKVPLTTIEDMAAHYIQEMRTVQPDGPYFLGGFCLGGIVAFEMAQQLIAQGQNVALLALLDSSPPQSFLIHSRISHHLNYFLFLAPKEKLTYILERVKGRIKRFKNAIKKIPYTFYLSIRHPLPPDFQLFHIKQINRQAFSQYIPQVYPGKVTLFHSSKISPLVWNRLATGGVESHEIPGGHTDMVLKEPYVQILADKLQACIDNNIPLAAAFNNSNLSPFTTKDKFKAGINKLSIYTKRKVNNQVNLFLPKESVSYSSLVPIKPNGSKPPLFFTNSIGAAKKLANFLGSEQPVYGLSIFGLAEMDEKQLSSLRIEDIAEQFIRDMRTIQPEGPYFIGAYCGDGTIAFEMAQQLHTQGQKVAQLALIDVIWNPPSLGLYIYWHNFRQMGFQYLVKKIRGRSKLIQKKTFNLLQQINYGLNINKDDVLEIKNRNKKLIKAFAKARSSYIPEQQSYPGIITLFLSRELQLYGSPGLANLAADRLEIQEVPGYHNSLFQEPYIQVLAKQLRACLDKAIAKENSVIHSSPNSLTTEVSHQGSLLKQKWSSPWSPLVSIQPRGSKPPLFWCHAGGGGVLHYRELACNLGLEQPMYGLQAQGLDGKQTPLTRIEDMVTHYIKEIQTIQPSGPYFLGGFCFGGILAFEMAQQLVAQGQGVALLALIETPCRRQLQSPPISLKLKLHLKKFISSEPKQKLSYIQQQVKGKSKWLWNRFKQWNNRTWLRSASAFYHSRGHSLPYNLRTEVLEQASKQAIKDYIPKVYPGKITLFLSEQIALDLPHDGLGWNSLALGGLEIHQVPGQHSTIGAGSMLQEPHVKTLAKKLNICIDKAIAEVGQK